MKLSIPKWLFLFLIGTSPLAIVATESVADDSAAGLDFFEAKIRPVLVTHCYQCHSAAAGKSKGNLLLDSRETIRAGGDSGPAVVPGAPDASLLLTAISHADPDLKMPPKTDRLPESVINDFKSWIQAGATDPREKGATDASRPVVNLESGRKFWSFRKPTDHQPPVSKNPRWAKRDLDHFILAQLDSHGLVPTKDADPVTLLRRLHFDLVGLPPTPDAVQRFSEAIKAHGFDAALAGEVDTLLASPHFGERWGRHWLDVARFAESSGKEANISFPYAWRYRDYVIDAVNTDMPFNRFLVEQIAGDLLPADHDAERARLLIATGFLAVGTKNLDEANKIQFAADLVDEQIDALTRGVIANSVACARCHDHKLDPFSMEDYYALAGVFASTKTYFGTAISPSNQVGGDPLVLPKGAGLPILHPSVSPEKVASLKQELVTLKKQKIVTLADALRVFWRSGGIEGELEKVDENGQALPLAMGVTDRESIVDKPLLERGEIGRPGKPVPRGFPRVIQIADTGSIPSHQSGRLELARWLTHPDHPLTARVMTNRIWRHLFGAGIVRSVDNFGFSGQPPSHPELLDHLAVRFVADGWSVKKVVREIALSRTYRQASTYDEKSFVADPENRLLWRSAKRRLDAEAIRDAMLLISGELDTSRRVGSLVGKEIGDRPISLIGLDNRLPTDLDGSRHRSVYLPVLRDRLPDVLDLFDFAEPSLVTGDRETTNVPLQALYLMNSPFIQARAKAVADRLSGEADDESRIRRAFLLCYSRVPTADEMTMTSAFLKRGRDLAGNDEKGRLQVLAACCQGLLSTAEFRNLD
ncbi:PSD1 and planctomycete cytochrome C domain-containing protein (plasmid) [Singulisphaera sp. Ch08]|uniref:PSD1 and planctomycete cytochrome C domain-containing protein n=1 Tax=Singulisphaera sp. Ch08 TaxID=3120278 RepID=A0AAU7CU63_9BACT